MGRILKIDLQYKSTKIIEPGIELYKKFTGGRGLAGHYLRPYCTLQWESPEMPLLFFTGPLCGTGSPSSGLVYLVSVSPLTGCVSDCAICGEFGPELKRAGWDGIIITGRSEGLCGIKITDGEIEFSNAENLKGNPITTVFGSLSGKGASAASGPAAEQGILYSDIVFNDSHFTGGNGFGTVMHSKGLKYIDVQGSGKTGVYDNGELNEARDDILRLVSASPALMGAPGISEYGTGAFLDLMQSRLMLPADNFRKTSFPGAGKLNAYSFRQRFGSAKGGCAGCPVLCKKSSSDGRTIPEFEAMAGFTSLTGNREIDTVMAACVFCKEQGIDPFIAASSIACYTEVKRISPEKLDLMKLLEEIAFSRGDGELLKTGPKEIARALGKPELSMTVKGLPLPPADPRGAYGTALGYAVSTKGGDYSHAFPLSHEILRKPVATERFSFSGKGRIIKLSEDMYAAADSLSACRHIFLTASLEEYSKVFRAVTGIEMSGHDLAICGERVCYNEKIMSHLRGFTSDDDDLSERFFSEPGSSGNGIKISTINREEFYAARERYYRVRGLAPDGAPLKEKCEELGLEWII